jgi:hypothetical protein
VVYTKDSAKVVIVCRVHGEFPQTASDHLQGKGCSKCGKDALRTLFIKPLTQVLVDFKAKHGDRYDYSLVTEYLGNKVKVPIICRLHGRFDMSPKDHLSGRGCRKCAGKS